jgi:hypothetical protein
MRPRTMRSLTDQLDAELVSGCGEWTSVRDDLADLEAAIDMTAEDRGDTIQRTRLQHGARPGANLFGWLQDEQHIA